MATSTYRPEQRHVPATILTRAGWMQGTFHVPVRMALSDFLDKHEGFLALTDVAIRGRRIPFLAIQRGSAVLVIPPPDEKLGKPSVTRQQLAFRQCVFLLEPGVITGTLELIHGIRVSDHLQKRRGFIVVHQAAAVFGTGDKAAEQRYPAVLLNPDHLVGVSDQTKGG